MVRTHTYTQWIVCETVTSPKFTFYHCVSDFILLTEYWLVSLTDSSVVQAEYLPSQIPLKTKYTLLLGQCYLYIRRVSLTFAMFLVT